MPHRERVNPSDKRKLLVNLTISAVFLSLFLYGLLSGGFHEVFTNGIRICLDCMGII